MEIDKLVSIIVPVYNIEKYISRCIESLLGQSYRNIEILLIDNLSQDASLKICRQYAVIDKRVTVLEAETNGVSVARNLGLKEAKGEYISFVDGDDWVDVEFIKILLRSAYEYQADASVIRYEQSGGKGDYHILDSESGLKEMLKRKSFKGVVWNKMFSSKLIKEENIYFEEDIQCCEDTLFTAMFFSKASRIVFHDRSAYHYKVRNESSSNSGLTDKKMTALQACKRLEDILKDKNSIETDILLWVCEIIRWLLKDLNMGTEECAGYKNILNRDVENTWKRVKIQNNISLINKIWIFYSFYYNKSYIRILKSMKKWRRGAT